MTEDSSVLHDLHTFMAQVSQEMASEYRRIYSRAAEDPGTAGDEGEENWAALLREWLPPTYHVETKGRLISHDGRMSPQIDVLVLKPSYPKKLLEKKVWLAGGVAAAFECKTTITAAHIKSAAERAVGFKSLYTERTGNPRVELRSPLVYGLLGHSHSWKSNGSTPVHNIQSILDRMQWSSTHPRLELNVVCVADLAAWTSTYIAYSPAKYNPKAEVLAKYFGGPWGAMTSLVCSSIEDAQPEGFQPIGALISYLTTELAWEDPSVRAIADYYRLMSLGGAASGQLRPWPNSVFSQKVLAQMPIRMTNGVLWDDWAVGGP